MTDNIHFLPFKSLQKIPRGNGVVNYLIANRKVGAKAIHTGISELPVGVPVPRHSHNAEEQVTVLKGKVKIILGDREEICDQFDSTFISANVEHQLVNVGHEVAYVFVVYGNPDVTRTFSETGKTVGIGSDGDRF